MNMSNRTTLISTLFLSAFLMASCSSDKGEEAAKKAAEVKDTMTESAKEMVDTAKDTATEAVESATEKAKETVSEVTEAVTEKAAEVKETVTEKAKEAASTVAATTEEVVAPAAANDTGKKTYDMVCFACHAQGIAGAPKVGDAAAWTARVEQGKDTLYERAINGYTGPSGAMMPAKGGRVDIADDDIKAAVDYMVEESK